MRTAVDSNIFSALWSGEPSGPRITELLGDARTQGAVVICAPVYVELNAHPLLGPGMADRFLAQGDVTIDFSLDEGVWRKAAEAFGVYAQRRRRSGGSSPRRVPADFIIAAHALLCADRLFTLDPSRYRQDFPDLRLV